MMEIVIKIPDVEYKNMAMIANAGKEPLGYFERVIMQGTSLPKGHGRLIDADALEEYFRNVRKELKASDYKSGIEFFVRDEMLLNVQQFIHLCDAIIEGSESE